MKKLSFVLCFFLCAHICLSAYDQLELEKGIIIDSVVCKADPGKSYALFLPPSYSAEKQWPILYALDPAARGHIPVELFRSAAEEYNYILVGSNDSRNGPWQQVIQSLIVLWNDTNERFAIDKRRIYVTGFSGGARAASIFSRIIMHPVAGIIGCGAGLAKTLIKPEQIPSAYYLGIVGITDFNFREMMLLRDQFEQHRVAHRFLVHAGGHDWPAEGICRRAIDWMEIMGMQKNIRPKDDSLITKIYENELAKARSLETVGEYSRALSAYRIMAQVFGKWVEMKGVQAKISSLQKSAELAEDSKEEDRIQELEIQHLRKFGQVFGQIEKEPPPVDDVEKNILNLGLDDLTKKKEAKKGDKKYALAVRLLHGLEIDAGSKGWDFFRKGELVKTIYFFEIAAQAGDKDSPRKKNVYYNLACAYARLQSTKKALENLRLAVEHGFDDIEHIKQDEDLASLRDSEAFQKIIKGPKRN